MSPPPPGASLRLVRSLANVAKRHRVARKLVVAPSRAAGRELLRRLSLEGTGWIGFELVSPRPLALRLSRPQMELSGLSALDAFSQQALLDEAMDGALASGAGNFGVLADGVGFRERVHAAIEAMRLADVDAARLGKARFPDRGKRRFLHATLDRYERLLGDRRKVDTADILRMGVAALEAEGARLPPALDAEVVVLLPGLGTRGLSGRLVSALAARGARVLETDPVLGLDTPEGLLWKPARKPGPRSYFHAPEEIPRNESSPPTALFRAASISDELREVLRRVAEAGVSWDRVEIVTSDPSAYGSALHALSAKLGIPVTYAVGLPLERTRTGRVVHTYLDWIEEGFQADPVRRLLEAGDLEPRGKKPHAPAALARRFRSLRIGWGRKRYRTQIREALAGADHLQQRTGETDEGLRRRRRRIRSELEALRSILFPTLRETPAVPDRMGEAGERVSASEVAKGLRAFLRRVPAGVGPDRHAREEVERILERIEGTLVRRTDFVSAVTVLRRHLDVRVRATQGDPADADEVAPWSSEGGHLHMSDLEHGGFSGRDEVYIVGLDVDRLPGFEGQDPLLLDGDRRILGEMVPTSSEVMREKLFRFAALVARLRGSVTLSHAAWDAASGRALGPSPLLLQALRLARRDPWLTFQDLDEALGRVACAIPHGSRSALDADDVWMSALGGGGGVMRAGVDRVSDAYPLLGAGLVARRARALGTPGPVQGVIGPRPSELDPRKNASLVVSASRLEDLGTCPLRYLQSSVLRIRPPDDPEFDPERWLDALARGRLLHGVFERTLREGRVRGLEEEDPAFEALALESLDDGIGRMRAELPLPGEGALRRETAGLRQDVRSFVRMMRESGARWVALELKFGLGNDEPVVVDVPGGQLRIRGAVDRVDEDLAGVHVVDYKSGVAWGFAGTGAFNGGRRLQIAVYAHAIEDRLGGTVVSGAYHFPTVKGENQSLVYGRLELAGLGELLGIMLDGVAEGSFVPTDRAGDCKFCDFAEICRAVDEGYGTMRSPLTEWSEEHLNAGLWPAFAHLKRTRTFED